MTDPVVTIHRPRDGVCWDIIGPAGWAGAAVGISLAAELVLSEVRRLGGRAVVVFDDQNSITARKRATEQQL